MNDQGSQAQEDCYQSQGQSQWVCHGENLRTRQETGHFIPQVTERQDLSTYESVKKPEYE